jgi:hypothetical protein
MKAFYFTFFASYVVSVEISPLEKAIRAMQEDLEHFDYIESIWNTLPENTGGDDFATEQWFYY